MVIYLLGFAISVIMIAIAEKQKTKYFLLLSGVALLIPCLIAGLRASNVGSDIAVYLKPLTRAAISADNISEYFNTYWFYSWHNQYVKEYDIAFSLLVYFVAKVSPSLAAVQFAVSVFIITPIYVALARNRKNYPVWLGMLIFYLFFYNSTLNLMRQWVAIAFLFLAFQFLLEKKWGLVAIFSVVAFLFHSSAVIIMPIYLLYGCLYIARRWRFVHNDVQLSGELLLVLLITVLSFLVLLNLDLVIKLMELAGIGRFSNYLEGEQFHILVNQIILRLPVVFLVAINWKDLRRTTPQAPFYLAMLLMDIVVSQLISVDMYTFRIGYYFSVYMLFIAPALYVSIPNRAKRIATIALLIAYSLFYWYYTYVMQLRHETYPYSFFFQVLL